MPKIICFYVPVPDHESAEKIITHLIDQKLIACGNILAATSLFKWKNKLEVEGEKICFLKTLRPLQKKVSREIAKIHSYDIPLIAKWKIKVNKPYYKWMVKEISV